MNDLFITFFSMGTGIESFLILFVSIESMLFGLFNRYVVNRNTSIYNLPLTKSLEFTLRYIVPIFIIKFAYDLTSGFNMGWLGTFVLAACIAMIMTRRLYSYDNKKTLSLILDGLALIMLLGLSSQYLRIIVFVVNNWQNVNWMDMKYDRITEVLFALFSTSVLLFLLFNFVSRQIWKIYIRNVIELEYDVIFESDLDLKEVEKKSIIGIRVYEDKAYINSEYRNDKNIVIRSTSVFDAKEIKSVKIIRQSIL